MPSETPPPSTPVAPPSWEALARFFAGESSDVETARVGAWMAANPEDAAVASIVNDAAAQYGRDLHAPIDTEAALASVLARRDAAPQVPHDIPSLDAARAAARTGEQRERSERAAPAGTMRRSGRQLGVWAAAAVVMVAVGTVLWNGTRGPDLSAGAAAFTVASATGAIDSLALSDGTRVVLGPGSSLAHESGFGAASREVFLTGDGYFDVAPDDSRPFTVLAGNARVVDLGTAFTVRSDAARGVTVSVTDGRVRLAAYNAPELAIELSAGQSALLPDTSRQPVREAIVPAEATEWTRGTLALRDAPLPEVAVALRRWFGVTFAPDAALADRRVTATFQSEPRETVLDVIALSLGARVEMRGDTAILVAADSDRR